MPWKQAQYLTWTPETAFGRWICLSGPHLGRSTFPFGSKAKAASMQGSQVAKSVKQGNAGARRKERKMEAVLRNGEPAGSRPDQSTNQPNLSGDANVKRDEQINHIGALSNLCPLVQLSPKKGMHGYVSLSEAALLATN